MRKRIKRLIQFFLIVVFVVCLVNFVAKKIDIARTLSECEKIERQIQEETILNWEKIAILSEENKDDFYRNLAEDMLGYGTADEKIYQDISGY